MRIALIAALMSLSFGALAQSSDTRYYELRIYYSPQGKLDALIKRFNDHTTKLFEKHGMENIGYWVPTANQQANALYYILAFPSKEARKKSWETFIADPEWKKVQSESEKNGKLIDSIKSVFMTNSGLVERFQSGQPGSIYELRTYHCFPGRLPNLITRFRDHTLKLFEKHGMTNVAYFVSEPADGKQSDLVYLVAHQSEEAATNSWAAFRADPAWIAARTDSEKDAKIVEKVETLYLRPLPFSRMK